MTESEGEPSTRPISVAELLARNGSIGSPPVGGRRRRRRGDSTAVTVAELTGEIPVIRDEPRPAEEPAEPAPIEAEAEVAEVEVAEVIEVEVPETADEAPSAETVIIYSGAEVTESGLAVTEVAAEDLETVEPVEIAETAETAEIPETAGEPDSAVPVAPTAPESPPRSQIPLPRRWRGPERGHDPRPKRRGSGAEQMSYDPPAQAVDLADLVGEAEQDAEQLRSYLRSSGGALFSGETVADDLARRGIHDEDDASAQPPAVTRAVSSGGKLAALRSGLIAVGQSVLAVVFGAGLFLGFDQLWRWNTIVALVLSVLVILGLVIAVRLVRKTEDIGSTLIAVAVGALVTLGPLALLQSYG